MLKHQRKIGKIEISGVNAPKSQNPNARMYVFIMKNE
jgi:hypothetical protein